MIYVSQFSRQSPHFRTFLPIFRIQKSYFFVFLLLTQYRGEFRTYSNILEWHLNGWKPLTISEKLFNWDLNLSLQHNLEGDNAFFYRQLYQTFTAARRLVTNDMNFVFHGLFYDWCQTKWCEVIPRLRSINYKDKRVFL